MLAAAKKQGGDQLAAFLLGLMVEATESNRALIYLDGDLEELSVCDGELFGNLTAVAGRLTDELDDPKELDIEGNSESDPLVKGGAQITSELRKEERQASKRAEGYLMYKYGRDQVWRACSSANQGYRYLGALMDVPTTKWIEVDFDDYCWEIER